MLNRIRSSVRIWRKNSISAKFCNENREKKPRESAIEKEKKMRQYERMMINKELDKTYSSNVALMGIRLYARKYFSKLVILGALGLGVSLIFGGSIDNDPVTGFYRFTIATPKNRETLSDRLIDLLYLEIPEFVYPPKSPAAIRNENLDLLLSSTMENVKELCRYCRINRILFIKSSVKLFSLLENSTLIVSSSVLDDLILDTDLLRDLLHLEVSTQESAVLWKEFSPQQIKDIKLGGRAEQIRDTIRKVFISELGGHEIIKVLSAYPLIKPDFKQSSIENVSSYIQAAIEASILHPQKGIIGELSLAQRYRKLPLIFKNTSKDQ